MMLDRILKKIKESSWIAPMLVTLCTVLFSWFFAVGFTLQTPRQFMTENQKQHYEFESRISQLENESMSASALMKQHTMRVCRLDTVEDLVRAGWLGLCRDLGIDRGIYNPQIDDNP